MRTKLASLFVLISSFVFSLQVFIAAAPAFKGFKAFETRVVSGITGNTVFYGFSKSYDVFLYYSALAAVPVIAVCAWFFFFNYPVKRLSALRPGRKALIRALLALPFIVWPLSIPVMNQFDSGLVLRAAAFFLLLSTAVYVSIKWDIDRRRPIWIFFLACALSIWAVISSNPWNAGLLLITISLGLLTSIFWLYLSEAGQPGCRKYAAGLLVLSIAVMAAGTALTGKEHEAMLAVFLFLAIPALCYAFYWEKGRQALGRLTRRVLLYDVAFLYYGYALAAFFSESAWIAAVLMPLSLLLARLAARQASRRDNVSLREAARVTAYVLSPTTILLLKDPLHFLFEGSTAPPGFIISALLFVVALCLCVFLFKKREAVAVLSSARWFALIPLSIAVYAAFFNPFLDGEFDYYHEAENIAYAHLFLKGFGLNDLYLIEHGLIQDMGLGLAAAWSFGPTLEGLRSFLMYVQPLAALSVLVLCVALFKNRSAALVIFLVTTASMLSFPVKDSPYPLLDKNFLRIAAPSLSIAFFALHVRDRRIITMLLSSACAFIGVLWSMDTGFFIVAALSVAAIMLDLKRNGLDIRRYRAFPAHVVTLALLSAALYLTAPGVFPAYADVIMRQGAVVQASAHALLYPDFGSQSVKTLFVAYVNPVLIALSAAAFLWLLLTRRTQEKDAVFLALILFSAAFFTRAVQRSDISHLIYASALSPVLLAMTVLRLAEAASGGRQDKSLTIALASYALFAVFPYNVFHQMLYPFKMLTGGQAQERPPQALPVKGIGDLRIGADKAAEMNALADFYRKEAAGKGFFDFTNNYGLTLWLLDAEPVTRSLFIAHENTAQEQSYVVGRLEEKKPGFVFFNSNDAFFDGISNTVRHPLVADYLFSNYRPYARVLDNYILARNDIPPTVQDSKVLFAMPGKRGEVKEGFRGIEIGLPDEVKRRSNRYVSLLMSVKALGVEYEKGSRLRNPVRAASFLIENGSSEGLRYEFKVKNTSKPVRYKLPLPDGPIDRLVFTPANFPAFFEIRELAIHSAAESQYPGSLSDWDMFEVEELGYIPYYLAKEQNGQAGAALDFRLDGQGTAEITGLDLDAKETTHLLIEASGKEGAKPAVFWDTGEGFFKDQAVYFKLKDGENRYLIDLRCLPSWRFSAGRIKRLRIALAEDGQPDSVFSPARVSLFSGR